MTLAGYALLVSAALHVLGVALAGFAPSALFLLGPAVLYGLLYLGLARGRMWVAWLAFIVMLVGLAGALSAALNPSAVPAWVFLAIFAADLAAAVLLFVAIWVGRRPVTEA